jgi:hypothetical protein
VVLVSLPTLLIPRIGFFLNGRAFQGILNQPQAFGVFIAPIASYLAIQLLLPKGDGKRFWSVGFLSLLVAVMFLSQARTSIAAFSLGIGFTVFAGFIRPRFGLKELRSSRVALKIGAAALILLILVMISSAFSKGVRNFVYKGNEGASIEQALNRSRGEGAAFYWHRFLQNPLVGDGFGVDVARGRGKAPETLWGIPVSASTEKGFLPVAFLEEVGIIGFAFFLPFFLMLLTSALNALRSCLVAMFFGCLFVNVGEAVFFGPGQLGGYLWLLIGLSTATGRQIKRDRRKHSIPTGGFREAP